MKKNDSILQRQSTNIRFKNQDMDFMLNWAVGISQIIGMSASQVFGAVNGIKDGDPVGWREGFRKQGRFQVERAKILAERESPLTCAQFSLGAAYAFRAALQYTSPKSADYAPMVNDMESAFQEGMRLLGVPIKAIEIPFENTTLPGYYLEHDAQPRPVMVMIGGGDTFREDLFYFAGYPGWKRGYNVIMVDLPGQGKAPERGLTFRVDMEQPIGIIIDWLIAHAAVQPSQIALYGVSGGGYFTALAAAADSRISAWIASTPIIDMAEVFRREMGGALKTPGWLLNAFMRLMGAFNENAEINLAKYAWQFGTADFKSAVDQVMIQAKIVNTAAIHCPSLLLVSQGEGEELKRQTYALERELKQRGVDVIVHAFTADEGADGHCELNNLRLLHLVIFDWLDQVFMHDSGDIRLRC